VIDSFKWNKNAHELQTTTNHTGEKMIRHEIVTWMPINLHLNAFCPLKHRVLVKGFSRKNASFTCAYDPSRWLTISKLFSVVGSFCNLLSLGHCLWVGANWGSMNHKGIRSLWLLKQRRAVIICKDTQMTRLRRHKTVFGYEFIKEMGLMTSFTA